MNITNQKEWEEAMKWVGASEEIIRLILDRLNHLSEHECPIKTTIDVLFMKSVKHYQAIIALCKQGYGQDACVLNRVLLEIYFLMKYIGQPTKKKDEIIRARQFMAKTSTEKRKFIADLERDVGDKISDEIKTKIENEILEYGTPDDWEKTIHGIASKIKEMRRYRTEYAYLSIFVHSSSMCFDEYINQENDFKFDCEPSDKNVSLAIRTATRNFSLIVDLWRQRFGKIKTWKLDKILKEYNLKSSWE